MHLLNVTAREQINYVMFIRICFFTIFTSCLFLCTPKISTQYKFDFCIYWVRHKWKYCLETVHQLRKKTTLYAYTVQIIIKLQNVIWVEPHAYFSKWKPQASISEMFNRINYKPNKCQLYRHICKYRKFHLLVTTILV